MLTMPLLSIQQITRLFFSVKQLTLSITMASLRTTLNYFKNRNVITTSLRYSSSAVSKSVAGGEGRPLRHEDVPEEEFAVSSFAQNTLVPEHPIVGLDLEKRIEKVEKKGSFSVDVFTGKYDDEFLNYPEPLFDRVENQKLKDQATMVKQLWPQIWDDEKQLQSFHFFNLFQLSVTEMVTIFEAIGASSSKCCEMSVPIQSSHQQALVSRTVISLITRNCLTYWPIHKSTNQALKRFLPTANISLGAQQDFKEPLTPIGFCWTEQAPQLGSLPPQEWQTFGQYGGEETDYYLITGRKTRILHEPSTENYLVYFRDKFLAEKYEENVPDNEPNPASDPLSGCILMNKAELRQNSLYSDSIGLKYMDVDIDATVPGDRLVFPAQRRDPRAVNIKALGQVATCSVILGILKDNLRNTYKHLIENKRGILECDIIERKLSNVTAKIFAIESMVYYLAGMYDGLKEGFDAHMEATILKIVTNEYAYTCLQELQQVCGSDMFIISRLQDQINIYDAFLDGNIYNRLYLATMGIIWFARSRNMHLNQLRLAPWYPGYFIKTILRERGERGDFLTLNADIYGHLHTSLKEAATNLEWVLKRVKYATETLCMRHGKDVTGAQSALYSLAQLSIDAFLLTTMCARASKSYCNGSRNSDIDVALVTTYSHEVARRVRIYIDELQATPLTVISAKTKTINELNIKMGGYYAESPLDPNI